MFYIEVLCVSLFFCMTPPPHDRAYNTFVECDRALIELVKAWKPEFGSYRFNCRRLYRAETKPAGSA